MSLGRILGTVRKPLSRSAWTFRGVPTHGTKNIEFRSFYESIFYKVIGTFILLYCRNGTRHTSFDEDLKIEF